MNSLYLHIPYCLTRCGYCDFHSSTCMDDKDAYVDALCLELKQRAHFLPNNTIETIYFGGGTPSLLSKKQLESIFKVIRQYYIITENAEITLESNPDDLNRTYLQDLLDTGFNRLSVGIQSFDDKDLKLIGRRHLGQDAIDVIHQAQEVGFKNISADLIFGLPFQTLEKWDKNLDRLLALNVQHISCYNLSYEAGTAFHAMLKKGELHELDDELSLDMYKRLIERSEKHGFIHYETSNFGQANLHSKHNSNYWSGNAYLGIGAGAHSYNGIDKRRWNISDNQNYIQGINQNSPRFEEEVIDLDTAYNEFIMTGLRTIWGCNLTALETRFGKETLGYCLQAAATYISEKQILITNNKMTISANAIFISDQIMADLMIVKN